MVTHRPTFISPLRTARPTPPPAGPNAPAPTHTDAPPPDPFAALADPTRRAILDGLRLAAMRPATPIARAASLGDSTHAPPAAQTPPPGRTAGDIAADFTISRPAVSKHLRILTHAGLVRVVKHGRQRRYHIDPAPLQTIDAWLTRYRMFWSARLVQLKERAEQQAQIEREADAGAPGTAAPSESLNTSDPSAAPAAPPPPQAPPPRAVEMSRGSASDGGGTPAEGTHPDRRDPVDPTH